MEISVEDAIKSVNTGNEESDIYYKSCVYYNHQQYLSCVKSLVELYHKYSKSDPHLFSFASYSLIELGNLIEDDLLVEIFCVHKSLIDQYNEEEIDLLHKSIFSYLMLSRKLERYPPNCIRPLLEDDLPSSILDLLPPISNDYRPIKNDIDFEGLKNKTVTNCYYNESSCGIGDFIRGSCYLFEILNPHNIDYKINFSAHGIGKYVKSQNNNLVTKEFIIDTEKVNKELCISSNYLDNIKFNIINALNENDKKDILLFSNYSELLEKISAKHVQLTEECQEFMRSNITYEQSVLDSRQNFLTSNCIDEYIIMHFRIGDYAILKDQILGELEENINTKKYSVDFKSILNQIQNKCLDTNMNVVVMSDSNELKQYVTENMSNQFLGKIHIAHSKSQHSSNNPGHIKKLSLNTKEKDSNMFFVALDMAIISQSKEVHSYSVYPWGSGFCVWLAKIYNIPLSINLLKS